MTKIDKIQKIANDIQGKVVSDYSGRGMFGKTCFGVIGHSANELLELAGEYGLKGARIDNMGRQYIIYWTNITKDETTN